MLHQLCDVCTCVTTEDEFHFLKEIMSKKRSMKYNWKKTTKKQQHSYNYEDNLIYIASIEFWIPKTF